jgi:hypothetical protein
MRAHAIPSHPARVALSVHRSLGMRPFSRETIVDRRQPQLRWSAVFGGAVLTIGLWILLQILGTGIGLAAIDPSHAGSLRGIGTGIWSIIAPLIAMFIGSYVAGRLSGTRDRAVGAMHGSVIWALALVLGLWAMVAVASMLASGAARVGGAAVTASSQVIAGAAQAGGAVDGPELASSLGVDENDLLGAINQRLAEQGKPEITADQLDATMRAVAQRGLREGKLDRNLVVDELARNTSLSRADAQDVANQVGDRIDQAQAEVGSAMEQVKERARQAALEAADKTGKAMLVGGIMMLLSLGAALLGGAVGVRKWRGREDTSTATTTMTITPPANPPTGTVITTP